MKQRMKQRVYRILFLPGRLLSLVCASFLVYKERDRITVGKLSSFIKITLALRMVVPRRGGVSLTQLSAPVSSFCQGFPHTTWDSSLYSAWCNGRENPLSGLRLSDKFINFYANLAARAGYLAVAWSIFSYLSSSNLRASRIVGMFGLLDLAILIQLWKEQLTPFYSANIWFDPDEVEGYRDDLSELFKTVTPEYIDALYVELTGWAPRLSAAREMYGEYKESAQDIVGARDEYLKGVAGNNSVASVKIRSKMLHRFMHASQLPRQLRHFVRPILAQIISGQELCEKAGWQYAPLGAVRPLSYAIRLIIKNRVVVRELSFQTVEHGLVYCENAMVLQGGMVVSHHEGEFYLIQDSKHLDIRHLKLFNPQLVTYDKHQALVQIPPDLGSVIHENVFVVTGLGWSFYHWMFETVPYVVLYEESGCREKMPIYFPFPLKSWHRETLELLGLGDIEVLPHQGNATIYQQCVFPTHSSRDLIPSADTIRLLRERLGKPRTATAGKRLFMTRKGVAAVRGMTNREEVNRWMEENKFVPVDPSNMSIREQIELFADAEVIAGEGGAALSNLVFCPSETKVLVMAATRTWAETFSVIAGELGQDFVAVLGDCHPKPKPYYIWTAFDYAIDPKDLDIGLRCLMEAKQ